MFKKSIIIPLILLLYLAFMAWKGYPSYAAGAFSALYYFGLMAATLVCIVLLHFNLRRAERRRKNKSRQNTQK